MTNKNKHALPPIDETASLKRRDAEALVAHLAGPLPSPACPAPPETVFLAALRRRVSR